MASLEEFTKEQRKLLKRYVTDVDGNVFVLLNLPEVMKGALFSRYSRSTLGLRSLLLKEFVDNEEEAAFQAIVGGASPVEESVQLQAIQRAQNFYDRVLDGYGNDSIGELGGAHLAMENVSMLAAKIIEDARIGGSPLEKSTRYTYFDHKIGGEYLFYREPILMTSAYRDLYLSCCNSLFDTYSRLVPITTAMFEHRYPKGETTSKYGYNAALRAKVLDCLRGLLPASTLTNLAVFGNGRFFETLIQKLHCHTLAEIRDLGKSSFDELSKVIPSFIRRAKIGHQTQKSQADYYEAQSSKQKLITDQYTKGLEDSFDVGVRLIDWDEQAVFKVAAALLFEKSKKSLFDLRKLVESLPEEELSRIFDAASSSRENRHHKSPRALEHANFTFEIVSNFSVYRDLQRHRVLTQERQLLSCDYGFYVPQEIIGTEIESEYRGALLRAKNIFDTIRCELPEEAQYVVPMAFNIRWYFHINLRALQWLVELRSIPQGHPSYRHIAQMMARAVSKQQPLFDRFLKFVDFNDHDLDRIDHEVHASEKNPPSESSFS